MQINYISEFEKRFGDINEDNLTLAAVQDPQFLADFISLGQIRPITKAIALSKLGLSHDDSCLELLKGFTKNNVPLVREGAFQGLSEYFFHDENKCSELLAFFRQALKTEPALGVQNQIQNLIESMEMYEP
jgi:hypothetical protein